MRVRSVSASILSLIRLSVFLPLPLATSAIIRRSPAILGSCSDTSIHSVVVYRHCGLLVIFYLWIPSLSVCLENFQFALCISFLFHFVPSVKLYVPLLKNLQSNDQHENSQLFSLLFYIITASRCGDSCLVKQTAPKGYGSKIDVIVEENIIFLTDSGLSVRRSGIFFLLSQ